MAWGKCDIPECRLKTYMGWQTNTTTRGFQVCQYHFERHCDSNDDFYLWDALGIAKPMPVISQLKQEKTKKMCKCGVELSGKQQYCTDCAQERERERKKEWAKENRAKKQSSNYEHKEIYYCCKLCGNERLKGHAYCDKCAKRQKQKSNRERQRRYRKSKRKNSLNVSQGNVFASKNLNYFAKNAEKT